MSREQLQLNNALEAARQFVHEHFPKASLVLLGGSWAVGQAHGDSDLDLVVIDESVERVFFEGVAFDGWIVEVCAISPNYVQTFFESSAKYRSAPVPGQVIDAVLVKGTPSIADTIRTLAKNVLACGPTPLTDAERSEVRYGITLLRDDIQHVPKEALPALSAIAHTQLSRTVLDAAGRWRGERKALRRLVRGVDAVLSDRLDAALFSGCEGNSGPMIEVCNIVLDQFGGPLRTYPRFSA